MVWNEGYSLAIARRLQPNCQIFYSSPIFRLYFYLSESRQQGTPEDGEESNEVPNRKKGKKKLVCTWCVSICCGKSYLGYYRYTFVNDPPCQS